MWHLAGNNTDCRVCAFLSKGGTLLQVPMSGILPSAMERSWVAAMVLNGDMVPMMRLLPLGELPAVALRALPVPRAPLVVADLGHQEGLLIRECRQPRFAWRQRRGGLLLVKSVCVQHIGAALDSRKSHNPRPWGENA